MNYEKEDVEDTIIRVVKQSGRACRVNIPKKHSGKRAVILIIKDDALSQLNEKGGKK